MFEPCHYLVELSKTDPNHLRSAVLNLKMHNLTMYAVSALNSICDFMLSKVSGVL